MVQYAVYLFILDPYTVQKIVTLKRISFGRINVVKFWNCFYLRPSSSRFFTVPWESITSNDTHTSVTFAFIPLRSLYVLIILVSFSYNLRVIAYFNSLSTYVKENKDHTLIKNTSASKYNKTSFYLKNSGHKLNK